MHKDYSRANKLTSEIIGAAIEVHRIKGPGLIESIYENCLKRELELRNIRSEQQLIVPVEYKGFTFESPLRVDLFVEKCVIVELKAVDTILGVHKAQLLSYMKLLNAPIGLIINFHGMKLKDGIRRMILRGADVL